MKQPIGQPGRTGQAPGPHARVGRFSRLFPAPPAPPAGPVADERGAIILMGVFMCIILVGALWFIAGVGDSIVYRERMQEAADAVVFSAATVQARGMNIIVMINLLMAAILAIRVAINMIKFLCTILGPIFTAAGFFFPPLEVIGDALDEFAIDMQELDTELTPVIDDALKGLNGAWKGVRDATPELAEASGLEMENDYKSVVQIGESDPAVGGDLPPETTSLPIEDGTLDKLCKEAGEAVGGLFGLIMGGNASVGKGIGSALADGDPTYFCQLPGATGSPPTSPCSDPSLPSFPDGGEDAGAKAKSACLDAAAGATSTALTGAPSDYAPAQVRSTPAAGSSSGLGWYNGSNESQVASILTANSHATSFANYDTQFVSIAAQGKVKMPAPTLASGQTEAWSQAEFFYDASGAWKDLKDDAMWNFYWRARFRLVKPSSLPKAAGDLIEAAGVSYYTTTSSADVSGLGGMNIYTGPAREGLTQGLTDTNHEPTIH
jgi:hypothetical protein